MHTSAPLPCLVTTKSLAAALTEWDRRYREEPDRFMSEAQHLLKETPETYGAAAGPYLMSILQEQLKPARPFVAICRHCTHHEGSDRDGDWCAHPAMRQSPRDLVTGRQVLAHCKAARATDGECGVEGRLFEARTVEGDASREEAEQRLGCRDVVNERLPYSRNSSWARRCDSLSVPSRSASIADSSMTACSGCARSAAPAPAPTVVLIGPQGCGKSTHAQAFAQAFGCTHVIDGESLNGLDVDDPAAITREGALIIGPERAEDCPRADLVIEARTKTGFDKAVALLPKRRARWPRAAVFIGTTNEGDYSPGK